MDRFRVTARIAQKEVRDALRNRWFQLYAFGFAGLALMLARLSFGNAAVSGFAGFGRTAASLVNLVLLMVPLVGLTLGAGSLAGELERGTLTTLLAQPVSRREVLLGKVIGLGLALTTALGLGFGLAGVLLGVMGGAVEVGAYATVVTLAVLLALASLALGLLISSTTRRVGAATGAALFLWLGLVFFGDLGLMGTALTMRLDVGTLFLLTILNPIETYRIAAVGAITGSLDVLGPAGTYAVRTFGAGLTPLLVGVELAWIVGPVLAACAVFDRRAIV